jgi:Rad3-related DNA helicase
MYLYYHGSQYLMGKSEHACSVQFVFISNMIRALNEEGGHALLEAPTGSGKTLSLLCAALAWQQKQRKSRSQVILVICWTMVIICPNPE